MTVYWLTIGAVGYLMWLARAMDPVLDQRIPGKLPAAASSRILVAAAALVLMGVAALRWGVGTDFGQYVRNYERYKGSFFSSLRSFDEPGIKAIAWVVSLVRDDAAVFMAVASLITVGLMLWTITRYSTALLMSYLLFIFVGSWHGSFNGVRQFLACAVLFAGHRFIVERKPLKYALVVLLAASFHISALAMIPLYLVPNKKLNRRMVALLVVVAVAALYGSDVVLGLVEAVKDDLVVTEYVTRSINPLRIAVAVAPVLLYWSRGVRTEGDGEWFYRNMVVVHAVVMLAASWSAYLGRFGIFTTAFLPLALPRLVDFPDRRLTMLARIGVVLLFAVFWYTDVAGSSSLNDFQFVFEREGGRR